MTPEQTYSRAPVAEAIIDLRVERPDGLALPDLEECWAGEEMAYPTKMDLNLVAGRFQVGHPGEPVADPAATEQVGFLFKSADERQLFQVHRDGFTLNRFAPYPGWERFRDEARRLWNRYREKVLPRRVVRLALRCINRLDLPGPRMELKDYLKTCPEVSPELPQPLAGFVMQLTLPQPDVKGTLLLTEFVAPGTTTVVLDLDLFRTDDLPPNEEGMWCSYEDLHRRSQEVFEACITGKTRELIR